jgi:hypothetical protein
LVRLAIRPVVLGKRIELISTADPYADLKPRDRGTIVDVSELPYEDKPFKVWVHWDSNSRLTVLEGHDSDQRRVMILATCSLNKLACISFVQFRAIVIFNLAEENFCRY